MNERPLYSRRTLLGASALAATGVLGAVSASPALATSNAPLRSSTDAANAFGVTNPAGLASWLEAYRSRKPGELLQVAALGHSIVYGKGSADTGTENDAQVGGSWVAQLRKQLNQAAGDNPREGWMLPKAADTRIQGDSGFNQRAPLARGASLKSDQTLSVSTPVSGSELWVMFWSKGEVPRVWINDSPAKVKVTKGAIVSVAKVIGLGSGTYSVKVGGPGAGISYVAAVGGITPSGIAVHRLAQAGHTMPQLVFGPSLSIKKNDVEMLQAVQAATWRNTKLGIIECLTNDQMKQTSIADYTDATRRMIDGAIANGCRSVLLVADPAHAKPTSGIREADYQQALRSLTNNYPNNVAYFSIAEQWGTRDKAVANGLYVTSGSVHPSKKGHLDIATRIRKAITSS